MSNYGAGYILAALPRRRSARQLSVLIALETFRCDADGWRKVSQVTLAATANVDRMTLARTRGELLAANLLEYKPGRGKGVLSRYKILIPPLDKGSPVEPFSAEPKRAQPGRQKGSIANRTIQRSSQVTRRKTAKS